MPVALIVALALLPASETPAWESIYDPTDRSGPACVLEEYFALQRAGECGGGTINVINVSSSPLGSKIPIILIHGIDRTAVPGNYNDDGWYNFIDFFKNTPELNSTYKLYNFA
jgi:hypothetical protein